MYGNLHIGDAPKLAYCGLGAQGVGFRVTGGFPRLVEGYSNFGFCQNNTRPNTHRFVNTLCRMHTLNRVSFTGLCTVSLNIRLT